MDLVSILSTDVLPYIFLNIFSKGIVFYFWISFVTTALEVPNQENYTILDDKSAILLCWRFWWLTIFQKQIFIKSFALITTHI